MSPGRRHPVRHLLAASQELHSNGSAGRMLLLRYGREAAWATLVNFLGLPADPTWADHVLEVVERKKRVEEIDGGIPNFMWPMLWRRYSFAEMLKPAPASA